MIIDLNFSNLLMNKVGSSGLRLATRPKDKFSTLGLGWNHGNDDKVLTILKI